MFTKPYKGYSEKAKSERCYYFEREWRFIPELEKQVDYGESEIVINAKNMNLMDDDKHFQTFGYIEIAKIIITEKYKDRLNEFYNQITWNT